MHIRQSVCGILLTAASITLAGRNQQPASQPPAQETTSIATPANSAAAIPGPVAATRLTEDYVRRVGAVAYLWGWPMVNMHNRKLILSKLPEPGLMAGIVPVAPMNQLSMVHDYIDPGERTSGRSFQPLVPPGKESIDVSDRQGAQRLQA